MSTLRQEIALENMVENGGNISQAMISAGYSPNTAKTPQKLTESLGFIELCEMKGLTDDLLINALVEDIKGKKGNRRAELELGFKIKGQLKNIVNRTASERPIPILNMIEFKNFSKNEDVVTEY
jgi:hypothetical protein